MASTTSDFSKVKREIDVGLGSIGRVRITAALARIPERRMTIYAIAAATGLKRVDIKANLSHLVRIGWVNAYASPPPTKYQINLSNTTACRWVEFLRSSGYFHAVDSEFA
jgi:hypothetical protein